MDIPCMTQLITVARSRGQITKTGNFCNRSSAPIAEDRECTRLPCVCLVRKSWVRRLFLGRCVMLYTARAQAIPERLRMQAHPRSGLAWPKPLASRCRGRRQQHNLKKPFASYICRACRSPLRVMLPKCRSQGSPPAEWPIATAPVSR